MPKLKLHKINGQINGENIEFVLKDNEISLSKADKILRSLGGSNKAMMADIDLSEEKEFKTGDNIIKFKYLNSFSSGIDKEGNGKENAIPFYVHSLIFEGLSTSGEKYYVERVLGFFNKEKNKIDISDWRFKVNSRITKELLKSEKKEIDVALEEVKKEIDNKEVRNLYVGTPISLISELKEEKNKN